MYRRILVPLDGSIFSERALPLATTIARATDATIELGDLFCQPVHFAACGMKNERSSF